MSMDTPLDDTEVEAQLREHPMWALDDHGGQMALHRTFTFANFADAFAFMTRVAFAAEQLNHHPNWANVYNTVEVHVSHHDAGGISRRCFALAGAMDAAANVFLPS